MTDGSAACFPVHWCLYWMRAIQRCVSIPVALNSIGHVLAEASKCLPMRLKNTWVAGLRQAVPQPPGGLRVMVTSRLGSVGSFCIPYTPNPLCISSLWCTHSDQQGYCQQDGFLS